jgi:HK97 family phage prohead protease
MIYTSPLILKFVTTEQTAEGVFSGLGSTWAIDRTGEKIAPGAFQKTLAAISDGSQHVSVLFEHDASKVIGSITEASESDAGLHVKGTLILGEPIADRAHRLMQHRAVGLSVGFLPRQGGSTRDTDGRTLYTDVDWMELSVTSLPANAQAVVHQVRSLSAYSREQFKQALLDGTLDPAPRRLAERLTKALYGDDDAFDEPEFDAKEFAAVLAEAKRVAQIFNSRK